MDISATILK